MTRKDFLDWFDELAAREIGQMYVGQGFSASAIQWMSEAQSAVAQVFPVGHPLLAMWKTAPSVPGLVNPFGELKIIWQSSRGVFASAHSQLREGRLESFVDVIRAEAEDEVIEQATSLLDAGYLAAATVLAGGALEAHLRRLCDRNGLLPVPAPPSIAKYDQAIAQARKGGTTVYEKADGSHVLGWGQMRNEAAHDPAAFSRSKAEVRDMSGWVRSFITRVR